MTTCQILIVFIMYGTEVYCVLIVAHRQQTATALPAVVCNKMRFCVLLAVGQLFPEDENGREAETRSKSDRVKICNSSTSQQTQHKSFTLATSDRLSVTEIHVRLLNVIVAIKSETALNDKEYIFT